MGIKLKIIMKYSFITESKKSLTKNGTPPNKKSEIIPSNVNVTIDQNMADDFTKPENVSPKTVYTRRLQVKLIKQILGKCPTAKAFRDTFKNSPIGSMRRLCDLITDETPLQEYIDFLQYKVVRWSMKDKLIQMVLAGFFGSVVGAIIGALSTFTSYAPKNLTIDQNAAIGAGAGALLGGTGGAIRYDWYDNDSVEKSIK